MGISDWSSDVCSSDLSVKYSGTFGDERYPAVFHGIKPAFGSNTKLARVETTERRQCSVIENDRLADRQDAGSEQRARGHLSLAGPVASINREGHRNRRRQRGLMIPHTDAVTHRRTSFARHSQLPSLLHLDNLILTRPVLHR